MDDALRAALGLRDDLDGSEARFLREQLGRGAVRHGSGGGPHATRPRPRPPRRLRRRRRAARRGAALPARTAVARAVDLERGRLRRSSGDPDAARPLFESAFERARGGSTSSPPTPRTWSPSPSPDHDGFVDWTQRGIDLAETHEGGRVLARAAAQQPRLGVLRRGDYVPALDAFERALAARERDPANGGGRRSRGTGSGSRFVHSAAPRMRFRCSSTRSNGRPATRPPRWLVPRGARGGVRGGRPDRRGGRAGDGSRSPARSRRSRLSPTTTRARRA